MHDQTTVIEPSNIPPASGELAIIFALPPVSQQANSKSKTKFRNKVHQVTKSAEYLLSGDVQIEIEWMIHERERYESDRSPDLDNIIKTLIDALSGPSGLIIDDNQVQHVSCSWIDWTLNEEQLRVKIKFFPDEWISKDNLRFIQFDGGLCMPLPGTLPPKAQLKLVEMFDLMIGSRNKLEGMGADYYDAKGIMPIQRVFSSDTDKRFSCFFKR